MMSAETCRLCSIELVTKIEQIEHEFSLMHHIKMDHCKTNKSHRCSLCSVSVGTLKNYVSHLNGTKHTKQLQWQRLQWKKRPPHAADIPLLVDETPKKKQSHKGVQNKSNSFNGSVKERTSSSSKSNNDSHEDISSKSEKGTLEKNLPNKFASGSHKKDGRPPVPNERNQDHAGKSQENQNYSFNSSRQQTWNVTVSQNPAEQGSAPFWQDSNQYTPFNQWDSQQIPDPHFNNFSNRNVRAPYGNNNNPYSWNLRNASYYFNTPPPTYNPWHRFSNPNRFCHPSPLPRQDISEVPIVRESVADKSPPDSSKSQDASANSRNKDQRSNEGSASKNSSRKEVPNSRAFKNTDARGRKMDGHAPHGGRNERHRTSSSPLERVSVRKRPRDQVDADRRRSDQGLPRRRRGSEGSGEHVQVSGHRVSNMKLTISRKEERRIVLLAEKAKNGGNPPEKERTSPPLQNNRNSPKTTPEPLVVRKKKKLRNHTIFLSSDSGDEESEEASCPPQKKQRLLEESEARCKSKDEISSYNQDLIGRLVNFPRTRKQQQQLGRLIQQNARSKKKLLLPRFNMQLINSSSGAAEKDADSVLEGMVCEVVGSLPDNVFKELMEVLKKDRGLLALEDAGGSERVGGIEDPTGLMPPWLDFLKSLSRAPSPSGFLGAAEESEVVLAGSGTPAVLPSLPDEQSEPTPDPIIPNVRIKVEPEDKISDAVINDVPQNPPSSSPVVPPAAPQDISSIDLPVQIKTEPPDPPSTDPNINENAVEPSNTEFFFAFEESQCNPESAPPSQLPEPEADEPIQQRAPPSISPRVHIPPPSASPRSVPPTCISPRLLPPTCASPRGMPPAISTSPKGVPRTSASSLGGVVPSTSSGPEESHNAPGGNFQSLPALEEMNSQPDEKPSSLQQEIVAQLVEVTKKEEDLRGQLQKVDEITTQVQKVLSELTARKNQMQREEVELRTRRIKLLETLQGFMTLGQAPACEDLLSSKTSFPLLPSISENFTYLGTLDSLQQLGMTFLNPGTLLGATSGLQEQQTTSTAVKKKKAAPKKGTKAAAAAKRGANAKTKKKKKKAAEMDPDDFLSSMPTPTSLGIPAAENDVGLPLGLQKLIESFLKEGTQKKAEESSTATTSQAQAETTDNDESENPFSFPPPQLPVEDEEEEYSDSFGPIIAHDSAILDLRICRGYLYTSSSDLTAKRLDVKNPSSCITYGKHGKTVSALQVTTLEGDRALVFTSSHDRYLRCFDAQSGICLNEFDTGEPIICMCKGWGKLYLGLNNGNILPFSITSNRFLDTIICSHTAISKIITASEGSQRLLCVVAYDESVTIRNASTGLLLRCLHGRIKPPSFMQVSGNSMYVSTAEKKIVVHDLSTGNIERVVKCPSSSTGLCVIGEHILSCSYDGLIRCYRKKDWTLHALYYGAGKAMTMCMEVCEQWVYTGNRHGMLEGFRFDPTIVVPCRFQTCSFPFGRYNDLRHHLQQDHFPLLREGTKWDTCPWRGCRAIVRKTSGKELKEHMLLHTTNGP